MALAVISGTVSTTIVGLLVLGVVVLVLRNMSKQKKAGESCGCNCSGCAHRCHEKKSDNKA